MQSRRSLPLTMLVACVLLSTVQAAWAATWANPELLVDAATVKANINRPDWVVVDCRDLKDYVNGHIPGAISMGKRVKKALRDPSARVFQDISKYEKMLGKMGIDNTTHVVFYHGDLKTITDATVGFWVLEYLGHDKVHLLDGGLDAWRKSGNRLDKTPTIKQARTFIARVRPKVLATTAEMLKIARNGGTQVIDSRTRKEFLGKDMRTIKGGHLPNATMNVSHLDTLKKVKDTKTGKMKSIAYLDPEAITKAFGGLDRGRRTIAYCQTGTRSTLTYLELRLMGFSNPANWDDSWRVWADDLHQNYPITAPNGVQFYNFDKVNKTLKKLTKKVAKLEKAVAALQKK